MLAPSLTAFDMNDQAARLRKARAAAGYDTAAAAARAMGIKEPAYHNHENGTAGLSRAGERYARFFRVNLDWLLTGHGEMRRRSSRAIPLTGYVGAGAKVIPFEIDGDLPETVDLPAPGRLAAVIVRGESMVPRFLDGEIVLYDPEPVDPHRLVGHYALVQTIDGRKLVKRLAKGRGDNRWILLSHNADPEIDVELMGAWRYVGTLGTK